MKATILNIKFILFLLLILSIPTLQVRAQQYNYFHYDIEDGLSGNTVYSIQQDKDGFLWFATETGLSRFDGTRFKNYSENDGLYENEIINLFVDSKNRVWIFPFKNSVYYYYHGKIYNSSNDTLLRKFNLNNEIFGAAEDKNGNIFFLVADRFFILSKNGNVTEITKIYGKNFYSDGCGMTKNGNCVLFLNLREDINHSHISTYEYSEEKFVFKESIPDFNLTRNAVEINSHYTVVRNVDHFEVFNNNTHQQSQLKVPDHFHTLSYIDDSCFAISTAEKTFLYNIREKKIVDSFLPYQTVNKCFKDNEDNLWFATMTHGTYRLPSTNFKIYTLEDKGNRLPVYALGKYDKNLYIGSTELFLWNLNLKNNKLEKNKVATDYNIGRVSAIELLHNQKIILGTDNGIFAISKENKYIHYLPRTSIKNFFKHNDSLIVVSDRSVFDVALRNFNHMDTIWHSRATSACKINEHYYIGTLSGLYIAGGKPANSLDQEYPLIKKQIVAMMSTPAGMLWVATGNDGLVCIKNNKIIYHVTTNNNLISNVCRCMYVTRNELWVGTDKGISKLDLSHFPFTITSFTAREGLDCEIINSIYVEGDSVFAGTPFGITFFNSTQISNKSICELRLVDIQSKKNNWYYNQDNIHLQHDDNLLKFEYTAISFVSFGDITYFYQLKGLDSTWQTTKQNSVAFESLPPGSYHFNIYALNKYGIKSKTISISFTKSKTFWQLFWVRVLLAIIAASLMAIVLRARIRAIRKNANERIINERKMHETEQMALRSQMNPHFIFNSLNSIQQYIFTGDVVEGNKFITNFSSLVRQTLYLSQKKLIKLEQEVKYLDTYLNIEKVKYENFFTYKIEYDVALSHIFMPPLLLQPFVENSIRHGVLNLEKDKAWILVKFTVNGNLLQCIVEDNGIGRRKSMQLKGNNVPDEYESQGIALVQKRIESLNAFYNITITININDIVNEVESGTRVTLTLPLNYNE